MGNDVTKGDTTYQMKLTEKSKLGEGAYGEVHKIMTKHEKTKIQKDPCAVKIFKIPIKSMSSLE